MAACLFIVLSLSIPAVLSFDVRWLPKQQAESRHALNRPYSRIPRRLAGEDDARNASTVAEQTSAKAQA